MSSLLKQYNGKGVSCGQNVNADTAWAETRSNLAKATIRAYNK